MPIAPGGLYSSIIRECITKSSKDSCEVPPTWDTSGCGLSLLLDMPNLLASVGEMISSKLQGEGKLEIVSKRSILVSQNELCKRA